MGLNVLVSQHEEQAEQRTPHRSSATAEARPMRRRSRAWNRFATASLLAYGLSPMIANPLLKVDGGAGLEREERVERMRKRGGADAAEMNRLLPDVELAVSRARKVNHRPAAGLPAVHCAPADVTPVLGAADVEARRSSARCTWRAPGSGRSRRWPTDLGEAPPVRRPAHPHHPDRPQPPPQRRRRARRSLLEREPGGGAPVDR